MCFLYNETVSVNPLWSALPNTTTTLWDKNWILYHSKSRSNFNTTTITAPSQRKYIFIFIFKYCTVKYSTQGPLVQWQAKLKWFFFHKVYITVRTFFHSKGKRRCILSFLLYMKPWQQKQIIPAYSLSLQHHVFYLKLF